MSIVGRMTKRIIEDDKQIFILWYELGSLPKVKAFLASAGFVNPASGRPIATLTISTAAYRWVIENPDDARPYYRKISAGYAYDDEMWNRYLVHRAMKVYNTSKKRFMNWIERRGFGNKYEDMYAVRFGTMYD